MLIDRETNTFSLYTNSPGKEYATLFHFSSSTLSDRPDAWEEYQSFCRCQGYGDLCTYDDICPEAGDPNHFEGLDVGNTATETRAGFGGSWVFDTSIGGDQWIPFDNGGITDPNGQFLQAGATSFWNQCTSHFQAALMARVDQPPVWEGNGAVETYQSYMACCAEKLAPDLACRDHNYDATPIESNVEAANTGRKYIGMKTSRDHKESTDIAVIIWIQVRLRSISSAVSRFIHHTTRISISNRV